LARARGKDAIELQSRIELTANHAAFARLGFRETGRTAHAGYDRSTSITMRKVLP
ncbi:MAG: GNAT family N-acetyltransferase, partial [Mesorhizobium sp.]